MPFRIQYQQFSKMLFLLFLVGMVLGAAPNVLFETDGTNYTGISTTVHIIDGNVTGYYYATEAFFTNGKVGYMGWQPRKDQYLQHLTFSAFGEGPYSDDSDHCDPGADGGDGVSCYSEYPWKFGQNYTITMMRIAHNETDGSNTWEGNIIDDVTNEKTKIAHYITPESYGLLDYYAISFDEYFKYLAEPIEDRDCIPESKYIQYAPVLHKENGETKQTTISYFSYLENQDDGCAIKHDRANFNVTKLSDTAAQFHNGILT